MKFDLSFGNSVAVRDAFLKTYNQQFVVFGPQALSKFDYPAKEGDPTLIDLTKKVIKRQINQDYKHVFLVNGATGGCVIAMRAYQQRGKTICVTRDAPYYTRYPIMIKSSGLLMADKNYNHSNKDIVYLIDLPSNPLAMMDNIAEKNVPVILDGVYLNNVYMSPGQVKIIPHDVYVGSYSKLLGLNGIRIGWIATNDDLLADRISGLITGEYCGLSSASQEILKSILENLKWQRFEAYSRTYMDYNREEWSKLERFFQGTSVKDVGMFYYSPLDVKAQELFNKAGIIWTKGSALGTSDDFARFNIGQSIFTIDEVVKSVLRIDSLV